MATPTTKREFTDFVKRKLGYPAIRINVTDEQVDDRVDEAVNKYVEQHYGGSEKVYLSHQLTAQEVSEKKITLDDTVIGVVGVFPIGSPSSGAGVGTFDGMAWQTLLSDIIFSSGGTSTAVSDYVVMRVSLNTISEFLVGQFPIRYNERTDELFLDCAQSKLGEGNYVVIEAYRKNSPDDYPDVWNDMWLQRYATALVKQQWGQNLSKFMGAQLPGGVNPGEMGARFLTEAASEIAALEDELVNTWSPISSDMIG